MPAAVSMRCGEPNEKSDTSEVYDIPLWLPSQISQLETSTQLIDSRLLEVEWRLRTGQAYEALDQIRHHLQIRAHVFQFKDRFVRGQGANTRARDAISRIQATIESSCDTYRVARSALASLGHVLGHTGWESQLPLLMNSDVRGICDGEDGQSEGRKQLSWIWKAMGVIGKDDGALHLRDCMSELIIKCRRINHLIFQHFALNGVSRGHGQCDSQRRLNSFLKKSVESFNFLSGKSLGG